MQNEISSVRIKTPARLHFSLIDLNGALGRIDGGIGVAIAKPNWIIQINKSSSWSVPDEIAELITRIRAKMKLSNSYKIELESQLPIHVGLGSQTQLAIAVAHGFSILEGKQYSIYELASIAGRGGTSGIGIAAYEQGGFILDGGHTKLEKPDFMPSHYSKAKPAVLVNRFEVPEDWYFVIAIPDIGAGKHGSAEVEIFNKYCPVPGPEVDKLSRIILMQMLPAIVERDIEQFGSGLSSIQNIGFKRIENKLQHKLVKDLQKFFVNSGAAGTGLSSFGPATFCIIKSEAAAFGLVNNTKEFLQKQGITGMVFCTMANNAGAEINTYE
ncbi:beta-ribofuranosylaminobenzene 5'-phosphate synthase [[Eubacterium] cellulosolvens]